MIRHQVVVIGGGLAGSACALGLNRAGVDVVAFERDGFPRRKVCGAFLSPGAIRSLNDLGVLERVHAEGAVPVRSARIGWKRGQIEIPFDFPGLGFSRERLDLILAETAQVQPNHRVEAVAPDGNEFCVGVTDVSGKGFEVRCAVVVDAAGRLSRFTDRRVRSQYGVAFQTPEVSTDSLEFSFFDGGYGGSVAVEGERTNTCFLVDKERVKEFLSHPGCIVTGPVGYERLAGSYLAIGDAAGMIDPFSGEGMRLALESGRLAARVVEVGLEERLTYPMMRRIYDTAWRRQWRRKKSLASLLRRVLGHRLTKVPTLALGSRYPIATARVLGQLWS